MYQHSHCRGPRRRREREKGHEKTFEEIISRRKFTAIQSYLGKQEKCQINHLTSHLKQLEKEQMKSKITRRKEIITIIAEMNEIEMKNATGKINETKTGSLKR